MASRQDWRRAFAHQARADLLAYEVLSRTPGMPACQHLHFVQMACEKICKAHLCGPGGPDPLQLQGSHAYIAKQLPRIAHQQFVRLGGRRNPDRSWLLRAIQSLARRIELLAPAVDDDGRQPANCEYPWETGSGEIVTPANHDFGLDLKRTPAGRHLLKVVHQAVKEVLAEV